MVGGPVCSLPPAHGAPPSRLTLETGEILWVHGEDEGERCTAAAPRRLSARGVGYWSDGKDERILYITPGYQLVALNAKTGELSRGFGNNGVVDLKTEPSTTPVDLVKAEIGVNSAPVVAGNVVIVGAAFISRRELAERQNERQRICTRLRRPDGKATVDFSHDSTARRIRQRHMAERLLVVYTGNTGLWSTLTVDEGLGIVDSPSSCEMPPLWWTPPGDNLFGDQASGGRSRRRASVSGTINWCTMTSGIGTSRRADSLRTPPSTAGRSAPWRSARSRLSCSSSTA